MERKYSIEEIEGLFKEFAKEMEFSGNIELVWKPLEEYIRRKEENEFYSKQVSFIDAIHGLYKATQEIDLKKLT